MRIRLNNMDTLEAKVRCLELAATVARSHANSDAHSIVSIATVFYNHVKANDEKVATPIQRGKSKKDNPADILG